MKQSITLSILFFYLFLTFKLSAGEAQCDKPLLLINQFKKHHFLAPEINDGFSKDLFALFFEQLDPVGKYLNDKDINEFAHFKDQLDDEIENKSCRFIKEATDKFNSKVTLINQWLDEQELKDYNFDIHEKIHFTSGRSLSVDNEELLAIWKKNIKYRYLAEREVLTKAEEGDQKSPQETWGKVIEWEKCQLEKVLNPAEGLEQAILSTYLNSIAAVHDPHSFFLPDFDKRQFDASIKKESEGFGINLSRNMLGEIQIEQLLPGSPAWNSDQLEKGDVISSLIIDPQNHQQINCLDIETAQAIFSASPYDKVTLLVRKKDGTIKNVTLSRASIKMAQNTIKSFILDGKIKIGYILIPSFYISSEQNKGLSADLAKELYLLKKDGINGLILDLRSNGGGSMGEALEMAGIFIDQGPLLSMVNNKGETNVIKDFNRGKLCNDPLLVMINKSSASAAELFAGCIQDYNRGILVGNTTFGKSTSQITFTAFSPNDKTAFANITTEVFYRVTGLSHQKTGVMPDVYLPEVFEKLYLTEKDYKNVIDPPAQESLKFKPESQLPGKKLQDLSMDRLASHKSFKAIRSLKDSLQELSSVVFDIDLKADIFSSELANLKKYFSDIDSLTYQKHEDFKVIIPEHVDFELKLDPVKKEDFKLINEYIQKDIYLQESYLIFKDFLNLVNHD